MIIVTFNWSNNNHLFIIEFIIRHIKKTTNPFAILFSISLHQQIGLMAYYEDDLSLCLMKNIYGNFGTIIYFHVLKIKLMNFICIY